MRKTIDVADVIEIVNRRLQYSTCSPEERYAMASILEYVLNRTGNYKGYVYLQEYPGEHGTKEQWEAFDDSRRRYVK
jgi:hypothetical protein